MELQELNDLLHKHTLWLADPKAGERASFYRRKIKGLKLVSVNLTYSFFSYATLEDCEFIDVNFSLSNFSHANLSGSRFYSCNLHSAQLYDSILYGTFFDFSNLTQAKLTDVQFGRDLKGNYTSMIGTLLTQITTNDTSLPGVLV